jgi:hypothetical protein
MPLKTCEELDNSTLGREKLISLTKMKMLSILNLFHKVLITKYYNENIVITFLTR